MTGWLVWCLVGRHVGVSSDVTQAFDDVIQPFFREETDNTANTDDKDETDDTDDTESTESTEITESTETTESS